MLELRIDHDAGVGFLAASVGAHAMGPRLCVLILTVVPRGSGASSTP